MMKFNTLFLFLTVLFIPFTHAAKADQNEVLRDTWSDFVSDCKAVFQDIEKFHKAHKNDSHYSRKESEDGRAIAINVGKDGDYLTIFVDKFEDQTVISCERFNEKYGAFNSETLSKYLKSWLADENNYDIGGGFVPLYDKSTHQFGVLNVFEGYDVPVRIRLFDWGIQFYTEKIEKSD